MFCKNCGKQLPEESSFCPYCMTKFTKETPVEPIQKKKTINKKAIIIAAVAVLLVVALLVVGLFIPKGFVGGNGNNNSGKTENSTISDGKNGTDNVKSPADDKSFGFAMRQTHTNASDLSDKEKLVLDYFNGDFFDISYDALESNHKYLKDAKAKFSGTVREISENKGNDYILIVEYGTHLGFDDVYYYTGCYAEVKCTVSDFKVLEGQNLQFFGIFDGMVKTSFNGEKTEIPSFTATEVRAYNMLDFSRYSKDKLLPVAEYIFGKGTTLRSCSNEDFEFLPDDFYEDVSGNYFVAELFHLGNKNFQKIAFYNGPGGNMLDCKTAIGTNRRMGISADFKHIYVAVSSDTKNSLVLECYNRSFEKEWSREFTESAYFVSDYTENYIYLSIGEKLYIIDAKTGKDAVAPKTVGVKMSVRKVPDGLLLVASSGYNGIVKTDLEGNEVWKISTGAEAYEAHVQIVDGNYLIQKSIVDSYGMAEYAAVTIVSPDGKVISNSL